MNVSFIHGGGPTWASFRYRAAAPARWIGASVNDPSADRLVFCKPALSDVGLSLRAPFAVDYCDAHLARWEYRDLASRAAVVTCPTPAMAELLEKEYRRKAAVIPDAFEFPQAEPHCRGARLLWFGHRSNVESLRKIASRVVERWPLRVVCNIPGAIQWSREAMLREFAIADIVVLPATAPHKSANRAIEATRQGCFIAAEPHPALERFPGLWVGDIVDGIEAALTDPAWARAMTAQAQAHVSETYSPARCARLWKAAVDA